MVSNKKLKIFSNSKPLIVLKIIVFPFIGVLLLWFTFDLTGLKFENIKIVTSAFIDEPIDVIFYLIFVSCIICFILKDAAGKYLLSSFLFLWGAFQSSLYFKRGERITSYNEMFSDTHHIIPASQNMLIKDTYHIILDILILLAFITSMIFMITTFIIKDKQQND